MTQEKTWFHEAAWSEGIQVGAHGGTDINNFYNQYHKRPDLWKAVFEFLKQDLKNLESGKYPIVSDEAFAMVMEYQTKQPEDAKWEAHRKYIDLQYIIEGEEKMGVLPLEHAKNALEYDEERDLIFFGENDGEFFHASPQVYFLFFPSDVHRPSVLVEEPASVKKLVIKIAVA
ncbi:MAG TPA: YhcH/YjgK/YiaL family protein [Sunxiuqinia sp.]|nr:YhcH/YjgK/YiaL family protein [Sunxiuqinia sp.]